MAVTKIHPIKSTMDLAIAYICDAQKTDGKLLVSSYGCTPETAHNEFELTRTFAPYNIKERANLGQHLIQSFAVGEVLPEKAHEIGKQFAAEVLKGKFEYVLTTHIDKGHVHNHLIFNSVDMEEHKKYNSWKKSYYNIRNTSDRLCRENGLSVALRQNPAKGRSQNQTHSQSQGATWGTQRQQLRGKIDQAIRKSKSYPDFLEAMKELGYQAKQGKHLAFLGGAQSKYIRVKGLGENYTEEKIKERIASGKEQSAPQKIYRYKVNKDRLKSISGRMRPADPTALKSTRYQREKQLHETVNTYNFLKRNHLSSLSEMDARRSALQQEIYGTNIKIVTLQDRKKEILYVIRTTEKYFQSKAQLDQKDTAENRKVFQSVRKQLMQLGLKDLPNVEALKIELAELNNGISVFERYAADKQKELSNLAIARENLEIIKDGGRAPLDYENSRR